MKDTNNNESFLRLTCNIKTYCNKLGNMKGKIRLNKDADSIIQEIIFNQQTKINQK